MLSRFAIRQSGFTLVEFMIGSAIGLLILAGGITVFLSTLRSGADSVQMTRLNQEIRAGIRLMSRDIRRAGYFAGVPGTDDFTSNPFMDGVNDIAVAAYTGEPAESCITFTYDRDEDATVDTGLNDTDGDGIIDAADMEQFGFRLIGSRIQMRTGGMDFACDAHEGWEDITDPTTQIDQLLFTLTVACIAVNDGSTGCPCPSGEPCQQLRHVEIAVAASRVRDANMRFQATDIVQVRNHKFIESAP